MGSDSSRICPHCQADITVPEASFCEQCGSVLHRQQPPAPSPASVSEPPSTTGHDDPETAYQRTVTGAMADGAVDPQDRQLLEETREDLQITPSQAARLEAAAMEEMATVAPEGAPADDPLSLEINDNHFYMEHHLGVLDLRLRNQTDRPIRQIHLSARGTYLDPQNERSFSLAPGARRRARIQLLPSLAGEHLVELTLRCEIDDQSRLYTAQPMLRVLQADAPPSNLTLVIDQRMQAGRNIGYGMHVQNEVKEGVAKGLIQSANDLLGQKFADSWEPLPLVYSEELSREDESGAKRHVRPVPACRADEGGLRRANLTLFGDPAAARWCLLAGQQIALGRSRSCNDIVLRVMPRSQTNDSLSLQITAKRPHLALSLEPEGLILADQDTTNGTHLDGQAVDGRVTVPLDRPSEVDVAGAMRLRLVPFAGGEDSDSVPAERYSELGHADLVWQTARTLGLRSLLIERQDELATRERYLVTYRWAYAGRGAGNEIILPGGCPQPRCLRVVRLDSGLWLESLSESGCAKLGGMPLTCQTACPLREELVVGCEQTKLEIGPFGQIGL
ncbi:MAG: hypothetical protein ACOC93_03540 [Planctomycetota bacterium]